MSSIRNWEAFGRRLRRWRGSKSGPAWQAPAFVFWMCLMLPPSPAAGLRGPVPGHPERMIPNIPPTETEWALWSQLIHDPP
ncbi:DUF6059 family protein [Streptomyces sp. NPDC060085]|uniref:DUF6059 family protein n=1 Tax=Streptomyces sp. NPDC060085 TaxID=3347054 RepID=UPI00366708A9